MRKVDRPLQSHEKAAVQRIFEALDQDASDDMSDDELRDLFQRFGFETNQTCLNHVGSTLRSWESERVSDDSSNPVICKATFEAWWPSILDYFERISATFGTIEARGEEGFEMLLQPFQEAGYGPALCSDAPLAVDKITHMCHAMKVHFRDSFFPAADVSIGSRQDKKTHWKRISEFIGPKALLFADGTNAGDTVANSYGRNKYAADITSLADRFDLLMTVVYPPRYNPAGIYAVKLERDGELVYVVVDDYIPVDSNNVPAFLRSADPIEFWPLIIDKAFAKLKTSYEKLHMSVNLMLDPIALLAGSRPSTLMAPKSMRLAERSSLYWSCIKLYMDSHWFLCSSPVSAETESGLILDHFYSIIGYAEDETDGLRLVQVRNPMGTVEWKGAWSDDAAEWKAHPSMAKRCLAVDEDDGGFWISIEDFAARFGALKCNALLPRGTIPVEEFEIFGRNMTWGTAEMAWRESQVYIDEKRKIREEMTYVQRFVVPDEGSVSVNGLRVMTPFDCPQFRLQIPPGQSVSFYFRGNRLLDEDGDGIDVDEELLLSGEFDAWRHLSRDSLQMGLPHLYIVRGDGRQTVLPTKHILVKGFSSYTSCTLSPGTYILMMMAFDRPDVPLKLVVRSPGEAAPPFKITQLAPIQNFTTLEGHSLQGLARFIPTGKADSDAKRPPFKEIAPLFRVMPSRATVKNITLFLIVSPHSEIASQHAGELFLTTMRDVFSSPFSWELMTSRSDSHSSKFMRSIYYAGSGQGFIALPFLTGVCGWVPFTLLVWSPQGELDVVAL